MTLPRAIEPEWLDTLPPDDDGAMRSRRDLQRLNFWMGHVPIVRSVLGRIPPKREPMRIIELGAGDGTFLLRLARTLFRQWPGAQVTLIDRNPSVAQKTLAAFAELNWNAEVVAADVFDRLPEQVPADVILANLFLHHFESSRLVELLRLIESRCRVFVACEPRRSETALLASRLLGLVGCHAVTRHDAVISVRAGFNDLELSTAWPGCGWALQESRAHLVSHLFAANKT